MKHRNASRGGARNEMFDLIESAGKEYGDDFCGMIDHVTPRIGCVGGSETMSKDTVLRPSAGAKRVLTGIKPTAVPHIGNYLGAIRPAIELTQASESYLFIADLHALTVTPDPRDLAEQIHSVAASWLAFGLDPERVVFYRQSAIPEVTQLAWMLSCVVPLGLLNRAHSFKDAKGKGAEEDDVSHGLFSYPVLMAADILCFDADIVPVGKDQKQHLEIAQEAARKFNHIYGETLKIPEARIDERVMTIPGTDGRKMSKSYKNTIQLFVSDDELWKTVKSLKTNSTSYGQPLDPKGDTIFTLVELLAPAEASAALQRAYSTGRKNPASPDESFASATENYFGFGDAKRILYELLVDEFRAARAEYVRLMNDRPYLDDLLEKGATHARAAAANVLDRVFAAVGLSKNVR